MGWSGTGYSEMNILFEYFKIECNKKYYSLKWNETQLRVNNKIG